jgi:hypothetical protein
MILYVRNNITGILKKNKDIQKHISIQLRPTGLTKHDNVDEILKYIHSEY